MGALEGNVEEGKKIIQILKKEKEYGKGNILYLAGGICWIMDLILVRIRYSSYAIAGDVDTMPIIIAGAVLLFVDSALMTIGKQKGNFQTAISGKNISYKEVSNITFEIYSGVVYAKGIDYRGEGISGEVCRACTDLSSTGNFQKAYYVEVTGKKVYTKVVLL